ncbi:dihydrofolate reductase [Allocatelliglobosispora scoriae]|uniref:Dihydrofolate reductase n=1 Tax=Allocatelliglobosispora scoriae TaxID=643052 RepID=A0A841BZP7_9ACTN|nr:dihydrofolate reductase family protein [Allocatelliglobosispora scoriae]MBB5872968.1 dihydrofolate reductase [Allocatelliglobosispora scoriae]
MRKLVVAEFISLDGVVEAPDQWHFPYLSEEMFSVMWAQNAQTDTMLLGRVTYESFAGAFANAPADDPVAANLNRPEKLVVSSTLTELTWKNSTLLSGDVVEQVTKLKEQPGRDILTTGSITLVRELLRAGLVDELSLLVHPIVVGSGTRLFEDGVRIPLALSHSAVLAAGVTHQVYTKA